MQNEGQQRRGVQGLALLASAATHAVFAALLIFGLPQLPQKPQDDDAIKVDLVPPPKPPEKAKPPAPTPPQPKPAQSKPPEQQPQQQPRQQAARQPAPATVAPVFQYGEKDAGPRKSPEGDNARDGSSDTADTQEQDKAEASEPEAAGALAPDEKAADSAVPNAPKPRPAGVVKAQKPAALTRARKLFSKSATDNPAAVTAMAKVPRDLRGGTLCLTELNEQLVHGSPSYFPDKVPLSRLIKGTVIDEPEVAFRVGGQWHALSYRCEVDADAMKVVSFAYRVGGLIPRSEWKRLELPSQ